MSQQKASNVIIYSTYLINSLLAFAPIYCISKMYSLGDVATWSNCMALALLIMMPFNSYYSRKIYAEGLSTNHDALSLMLRQSPVIISTTALIATTLLLFYLLAAAVHPELLFWVQDKFYIDNRLLFFLICGFIVSSPARLIRLILSLPIYSRYALESALVSMVGFIAVAHSSIHNLGIYGVLMAALAADLAVNIIFVIRFRGEIEQKTAKLY